MCVSALMGEILFLSKILSHKILRRKILLKYKKILESELGKQLVAG